MILVLLSPLALAQEVSEVPNQDDPVVIENPEEHPEGELYEEQEVPEESQENDDNEDSDSNINQGSFTSSSAKRLHYPEETVEEETTNVEETTEEETTEETTSEPQEKGFWNSITGFVTGYGSQAGEDANVYLYPIAVLLCVGIIVFVAREY